MRLRSLFIVSGWITSLLLLATAPASAEKSALADEIFDLWSTAYSTDAAASVETEMPPAGSVAPPVAANASRSLTPHLDRLLGPAAATPAGSAVAPSPAQGSLDHDTFFENPPMTQQFKGSWSHDARHWGHERQRDSTLRSPCGHDPGCDCGGTPVPEPVPEPGTLLLAGAAGIAAWGARRRARRQAHSEN